MENTSYESQGFISGLIGDGRPLLSFTGLALGISGAVCLFLSLTGSFLPQDVSFLGMQPEQLCAIHQCRVVHFMFHDRVSFGGALLSIATFYLWLANFPLKARESWAWWTFTISGGMGFLSFLCYLGYGYLDTWHGVATLALLPLFLTGLYQSRKHLDGNRSCSCLFLDFHPFEIRTAYGLGRCFLMMTALGQVAAGAVIMSVGMTSVFVPEDLIYLQLSRDQVSAINQHLIPLIAHDRAGFGGAIFSCGILLAMIILKARPSRHLWEAICLSGGVGFACAIGVHFCIGYLNPTHIAPAFAGLGLFSLGMALTYRRTHQVKA